MRTPWQVGLLELEPDRAEAASTRNVMRSQSPAEMVDSKRLGKWITRNFEGGRE